MSFIDSLSKTKKNLLLGGFLIGALALTVFVSLKPTNFKPRASEIVSPPTTTGNITLALSAPSTQLTLNQATDVDIYLEAGNQNITGLSFTVISVDNSVLVPQRVTIDTSLFNNQLRSDLTQNSYNYAAVDTVGRTVNGRVKLGTLRMLARKVGFSDLRFQSVQATALGQTGILGNQQNVNLQFTVVSQTTPTISVPTATPTPGIIGSCKTLYDKILAAYNNVSTCGTKYDSAADINKDRFVNNQDYLLFLQNTGSGTNQVACTNYLSNTTNPCLLPSPTVAPPTATPSGPVPGDATGDRIVDIRDYNRWKDEYLGTLTTKTADFNKDGRVDLIDFSIFRNAFNPTSASPTPVATSKRVFITSTFHNGNLGGLSGGDAICQTRANTANLGGTWKAWLSDSTTSAASRLNKATVPYKLIDGTTIANNWTDLTDGKLIAPINKDEFKNSKSDNPWTGTLSDGSKGVDTTSGVNCTNWTTNSSSITGVPGYSYEYLTSTWSYTDRSFRGCSNQLGLYCFEQ